MASRYTFRKLFSSLHKIPAVRRMHILQCSVLPTQPPVNHRILSPKQSSPSILLRRYLQTEPDEEEELSATEELANLSPEMKYQLELIKMQHMTAISQFKRVLEDPTDEDWLYIVKYCDTSESRLKHLLFLSRKISMRDKKKRKQEEKELAKPEVSTEQNFLKVMPRVMQSQINSFQTGNLLHAMQHGPDVVLDMSFCDSQPMRAVKRVFLQLGLMIGANKKSRQPFHLHITGVTDQFEADLYKLVPGIEHMPVTISKKSYLDHFPKENLVYLSPDAPRLLKKYDGNDVYIIGGIVDLAGGKFSYPKAKREGIRSAKLPLEYYVDWKQGTKALTLDQVYNILLTAAETKSNWGAAFEHLPKRKLQEKGYPGDN